MNWDLDWSKKGAIEIASFPVYADVFYSELVHDPLKINIENAALNYTHMIVDDAPVVYAEIPVIKHWSLSFHYLYKLLWWHEGDMMLEVNDMHAICTTGLKATTDGHIFPYLHDLTINIEGAKLYHNSWWAEFWYRQGFELSKYII